MQGSRPIGFGIITVLDPIDPMRKVADHLVARLTYGPLYSQATDWCPVAKTDQRSHRAAALSIAHLFDEAVQQSIADGREL